MSGFVSVFQLLPELPEFLYATFDSVDKHCPVFFFFFLPFPPNFSRNNVCKTSYRHSLVQKSAKKIGRVLCFFVSPMGKWIFWGTDGNYRRTVINLAHQNFFFGLLGEMTFRLHVVCASDNLPKCHFHARAFLMNAWHANTQQANRWEMDSQAVRYFAITEFNNCFMIQSLNLFFNE